MTKTVLIIFTVIFLAGCVIAPPVGKTQLDKKHFSATVTVYDQPDSTTVTFSTIKGLQSRHGQHKVIIKDNFLRGFIDKNTGAKSYQVYNLVHSAGLKNSNDWKRFEQVNFLTLAGERFILTSVIKKQKDCSALPTYGKCIYTEHITFMLDEALIKAIVSKYTPLTPMAGFWQYILIPKLGNNYVDKISVAEVVGLLEEMDKYIIPMLNTQPETVNGELSTMINSQSIPEPLIIPNRAMAMLSLLN